jgi:hypothetical protein
MGLLIILGGQFLFANGNRFVRVWLTPIMWTGYILWIDGIVFQLRKTSWLSKRFREFPLLLLVSVGVWLIFEAYNFHLQNWLYKGVPQNPWLRNLAYFWSFATIMPGVFETSDLVEGLLERKAPHSLRQISTGPAWSWWMLGTALITIPLVFPIPAARFLFGFIWMGFIFFLDPIAERLGTPSLRIQLKDGAWLPWLSLLISGMICGLLWETWNYQAFVVNGGHWIYSVPEPLRVFNLHFGKMPLLGLLGFPPFAIELALFYKVSKEYLGGKAIFGPRDELQSC